MPLPDLSTILQLSPEELAPQLLATLKEKWPRPGERISLGYIVSNLDRPVARCVAEAWSALETGGSKPGRSAVDRWKLIGNQHGRRANPREAPAR